MKVLILGSAGYLGARLGNYLVDKGYEVTGVDIGQYGTFRHPEMEFIIDNYARLNSEFIQSFERVILLAGHSSVPLCLGDPTGSYINNVVNFIELCAKYTGRIIYASSASVCNGLFLASDTEVSKESLNNYDSQKQALEEIALDNCVGLRFGTLAGWSPNPRLEIMINSMVWDGVNTGQVNATNANNFRSVLGTLDACRAIEVLLEAPEVKRRVYNLASISSSVRDFAVDIACELGVPSFIAMGGEGFSFTLDTSAFQQDYNFEFRDTLKSIVDECRYLTKFDKAVYNRSTNLFKYEDFNCT